LLRKADILICYEQRQFAPVDLHRLTEVEEVLMDAQLSFHLVLQPEPADGI
jgi:hypothetical protein